MQVLDKVRSLRRLPTLLVLANGIVWLLFIVKYALVSQPYRPHVKHFEEQSPSYIFWGHAFPFEQFTSPIVRIAHLVNMPSFYAAAPLNFFCSSRGIVVDDLYFGISEGGYYLILVSLFSFLQWYLIGLLLHAVIERLRRIEPVL